MHRIKIEELAPRTAPTDQPFPPTLPFAGIIAGNIAAAAHGQCTCGEVILGIRHEADRGSEVSTNLPCGHTRGPA